MPSHKIHRLISKLLLGKEYPDVDRFADLISGPNHRKVWGHDKKSVLLTYILTKDPDRALAHCLHIAADNYFSKLKKRLR